MTTTYFSSGVGPQKSTETCSNGPGGSADTFSGERSWWVWWLDMPANLSTVPENHTFSLRSCFVVTRPWCPSCVMASVRACSVCGMTSLVPRCMRSLSGSSVSSSLMLWKDDNVAASTPVGHGSFNCPLLMRLATSRRLAPSRVAHLISSRNIALGTMWTPRKSM